MFRYGRRLFSPVGVGRLVGIDEYTPTLSVGIFFPSDGEMPQGTAGWFAKLRR